MADDPFLSPTKGSQGLSLAQREFRRREVVRGVVAVLIGLGAVAALLPLFGLGPFASGSGVGRGASPVGQGAAQPSPRASHPGTISLQEQLLPIPSPRVGAAAGQAPFVVPAGQVHRPVLRPDLPQAPPPRWRMPPNPGLQRPPSRPPRPQHRPVRHSGQLVPVAPQPRGDALDPPEAPLETLPQ